jgi:hypothetical protein
VPAAQTMLGILEHEAGRLKVDAPLEKAKL